MNLNWRTPPKRYEQTIQYTDNYVVHGRGYTIGRDLWFDEYALRSGHHRHWNDVIRHEYGFPEWEPRTDWDGYAKSIEPSILYWSITGAPAFVMQYPDYDDMTMRHWELLEATLETMHVDIDQRVRFSRNDDREVVQKTLAEIGNIVAGKVKP